MLLLGHLCHLAPHHECGQASPFAAVWGMIWGIQWFTQSPIGVFATSSPDGYLSHLLLAKRIHGAKVVSREHARLPSFYVTELDTKKTVPFSVRSIKMKRKKSSSIVVLSFSIVIQSLGHL